jgi:hypothetical protein
LEILHDQKVHTVLVADVIEGADAGVRETGDGLCFPVEPSLAVRILGEMRRENLDHDRAAKPRVTRPIDLAHSSGPERREYFVGSESRARAQ